MTGCDRCTSGPGRCQLIKSLPTPMVFERVRTDFRIHAASSSADTRGTDSHVTDEPVSCGRSSGDVVSGRTYVTIPDRYYRDASHTYTAPACGAVLSFWLPLMPAAPPLSMRAPVISIRPSPLTAMEVPNSSNSSAFSALM